MISIGSTVGNYEVIAKLGSGAMGSVFLAEHPSIGKRVALKVIHSDLAGNAEMVSRFFTEARAVTQIANEHIVDVQNFGQTPEGDNFIIMEFLEGKSLGSVLKEQPILPLDVAMHVSWQVADGLAASHARGIIHRDLKPDNIFLIQRRGDPWFVKILDFGLAKLTQGGGALSHKTQAGSVLGTPHYMAPEQCEGKPDIDHRVDVYALGCIMYEMLCGRVPFPGEGFGEVLVKHLREPPQMPTRVNPRITKAIEKIILHALAKKKEFRFAGMAEFRGALGDPDAYSRALDGDRPINISTLELLAQSPVNSEHQAPRPLTDQATMMADAVLPGGANGPTIVTDAPVLPEGAVALHEQPADPAATRLLDAPVLPDARHPSTDSVPMVSGARPRSGSGGIVLGIVLAILLLGGGGAGAYFFLLKPKLEPVVVTSDPPGAQVTRDGQLLGRTPLVIQLPHGAPAIEVVLRKDGFLDARRSLDPVAEPAVMVKLKAREEDPKPIKVVPIAPTPTPVPEIKKPTGKPTGKPSKRPTKKQQHNEDDVLEPHF